MPFVLNGSPLIFSPCFVFLLFFLCFCIFVFFFFLSRLRILLNARGLLGLSSVYFEAS